MQDLIIFSNSKHSTAAVYIDYIDYISIIKMSLLCVIIIKDEKVWVKKQLLYGIEVCWFQVLLNTCTLPSDRTMSNCPHQVCNCNRFEDKYHKPSYFWSSHLSAALINCSWSCCYQRWWFSPWFPSGVLPHSRTGNSAPGSLCGRSGRQVSCTLALLCLVLGGQRSQTRTKSHHSSPH